MLTAVLLGAAAAATLAAASALPRKAVHPGTKISHHLKPRAGVRPRRHVNPALVRRLRSTTWRWQTVIGVRHAHSVAPLRSPRALRYWRLHARQVSRLAANPPHKRGWLCIHHFEGSWSDSGDPYWGGLQMDRGFMRTYAPRSLLRKGWANRWTPLEQMWVAERASRSGRGYNPWPNTARYCGLL
jgi:hypothetical protein